MKQISDKVILAIRRCKNKGKKITAAEARDSTYWTNLSNLTKAITYFANLGTHLLIWKQGTKTFLQ